MAVNTIRRNSDKIRYIDILTKIEENQITISIRDPGIEFDPSTYSPEEEESSGNIEVLKKMADDISYQELWV